MIYRMATKLLRLAEDKKREAKRDGQPPSGIYIHIPTLHNILRMIGISSISFIEVHFSYGCVLLTQCIASGLTHPSSPHLSYPCSAASEGAGGREAGTDGQNQRPRENQHFSAKQSESLSRFFLSRKDFTGDQCLLRQNVKIKGL